MSRATVLTTEVLRGEGRDYSHRRRPAQHGIQINALAPGYFKTPLNQALVDDPDFSAWLEKRTPAGRWGDVDELVGAAVFLAARLRVS